LPSHTRGAPSPVAAFVNGVSAFVVKSNRNRCGTVAPPQGVGAVGRRSICDSRATPGHAPRRAVTRGADLPRARHHLPAIWRERGSLKPLVS
jgi:hypothetical protein